MTQLAVARVAEGTGKNLEDQSPGRRLRCRRAGIAIPEFGDRVGVRKPFSLGQLLEPLPRLPGVRAEPFAARRETDDGVADRLDTDPAHVADEVSFRVPAAHQDTA